MSQLSVNAASLLFSLSLVLVALAIAYKEHLGLEKDIIYSIVRAVIQLIVVGFLLKYIFNVNQIFLTLSCVLIIYFNAAWNAAGRMKGLPGAFLLSFLAIFSSTTLTLCVLLITGSLRFIPSQVIPITGMIASNSMIAIGLSYRHLSTSFHDQRQQIQEKLALGATIRQASHLIIRASIKTGMSPTIDSAKTVGIVSLPGMMSGLIFAGVDPVRAIGYQIMVTFMLLSATSISSMIACYSAYSKFFTRKKQLRE